MLTYKSLKPITLSPTTEAIPEVENSYSVGDWVFCVYGKKWYVAKVAQDDQENEELQVAFYKGPDKGPEGSASWVPYGHVLLRKPSDTPTRLGRAIEFIRANLDLALSDFLSTQSSV